MRTALIVLVLICTPIGTVASFAQTQPDADALIVQWTAQNTICRGSSGDKPETQRACEERQRIGRALDALGWCYGKRDQMAYQMQWHDVGPTPIATNSARVRRWSQHRKVDAFRDGGNRDFFGEAFSLH